MRTVNSTRIDSLLAPRQPHQQPHPHHPIRSAMAPPLFRLIQANGLFFIALGQGKSGNKSRTRGG
jgi:hypothetical protein